MAVFRKFRFAVACPLTVSYVATGPYYGGKVPQTTRENSRRILVVDDDTGIVKAMDAVLKKTGFETITCLTGADALDKAVTGIDAVVVDIHLPDMSGLDLSQKLRGVLGSETPIIILSGDTSIQTLRALPDAGATHFFSKPVNTNQLITRLKEWTGM